MYKQTLTLCAILCMNFASAQTERVGPLAGNGRSSDPSVKSIVETMKIIKEEYVGQVAEAKLVESAINGMLSALDPHSVFYNSEALKEMELHTSGEFEGVGIEVTVDNGLTRVITPIDDSPAQKAGIKAGDYIISINDESIYGLSTYETIQKIRGKPNTPVKLTILREDSSAPIEFNLNREKIKISSMKSQTIENNILYLRIGYFYGNTSNLVEEALKQAIRNNKLQGIIIDLRNNPGGLLDQAVRTASLFVDEGDIVYTKGKDENNVTTYAADKGVFKVKNIPVVVLINNGSASAAEIVAGALQDHKKAAILGIRSFGKGSVQSIIPVNDDGAISLTTSLYYTPSGKSIQLEGVIPDIVVEDIEIKKFKEGNDFREEDIQGHLEKSGNLKRNNKDNFVEKIKRKIDISHYRKKESVQAISSYKSDYMIIRALDLIKGINIYALNKQK